MRDYVTAVTTHYTGCYEYYDSHDSHGLSITPSLNFRRHYGLENALAVRESFRAVPGALQSPICFACGSRQALRWFYRRHKNCPGACLLPRPRGVRHFAERIFRAALRRTVSWPAGRVSRFPGFRACGSPRTARARYPVADRYCRLEIVLLCRDRFLLRVLLVSQRLLRFPWISPDQVV